MIAAGSVDREENQRRFDAVREGFAPPAPRSLTTRSSCTSPAIASRWRSCPAEPEHFSLPSPLGRGAQP
jgi:hypothetical protein